MPSTWCSLVLLLMGVLFGLLWTWRWIPHPRRPIAAVNARVQRLLKPHKPDDCPICRQQAALLAHTAPLDPRVTPWREFKSRRGAPKRIDTQGFACHNRSCMYYQITDAQIHALVGDGTEGRHERIQTFRCQACGATCSARRHTPLYRLKTPSHRVGEVLTALAEGLDVSAATRVFGYRPSTLTTWLTRAGEHSTRLHDCVFRNLHLPHIQLDELRTRLRSRAHTLWLWVAVDPLTKIIPVLYLGARTQAAAHTTVHELRERLAPDCIPVCTSDGLNQYFYALTAQVGLC
jgi:hypothetical protein